MQIISGAGVDHALRVAKFGLMHLCNCRQSEDGLQQDESGLSQSNLKSHRATFGLDSEREVMRDCAELRHKCNRDRDATS